MTKRVNITKYILIRCSKILPMPWQVLRPLSPYNDYKYRLMICTNSVWLLETVPTQHNVRLNRNSWARPLSPSSSHHKQRLNSLFSKLFFFLAWRVIYIYFFKTYISRKSKFRVLKTNNKGCLQHIYNLRNFYWRVLWAHLES